MQFNPCKPAPSTKNWRIFAGPKFCCPFAIAVIQIPQKMLDAGFPLSSVTDTVEYLLRLGVKAGFSPLSGGRLTLWSYMACEFLVAVKA